MSAVPGGGDGKVTRIGSRLAEAREVKRRSNGGLPEDCPVYALGMSGTHSWFMNTLQQIVAVPMGRMSGAMIQGLFSGHDPFLRAHWPRFNKNDDVIGFENQAVSNALLAACKDMGMYDGRQDIMRGCGAHPGEDGDLVLNLGNMLWVRGQVERLGARDDGYIYPRGLTRAAPHPTRQPQGPDGPAAEIEDVLRCWNWRNSVYPRLLLGWLGMALIGGAVSWRPHIWINAPHGSGKSTLLSFVRAIMGDLHLHSEDITAASLRINLGYDTIAAILDETEAKADDTRINGLVEMARLASSGGKSDRATSDLGTMSFILRTSMLMASVAHPPLRSQDQSRFAVLKLDRPAGGAAPKFLPERLKLVGRQLLRRMVDRFKDLPRAFDLWHASLVEAGVKHGHDPQQYGMLLACADLAMWDEIRDETERGRWAQMVAELTVDARAEQLFEWQRVLQLITSSVSGVWRGGDPMPIGDMVARAARRQVLRNAETGEDRRPTAEEAEEANRKLGSIGLRVVPLLDGNRQPLREWADDPKKLPAGNGTGNLIGWLAVANSHAALNATVFRGTHWAAKSGTSGGWKAALQEAPGAETGRVMRLGGVATRCVLVPLDLVLDGEREGAE